jgi:gliding motility-associated-like protein
MDAFTLAREYGMKKIIFILLFFFPSVFCFAGHIAGGEVYYKYLGPGAPGFSRYEISLRLFRECIPPPPAANTQNAEMPVSVLMNIYNNTSPSSLVQDQIAVARTSYQEISINNPNPCITPKPTPNVCYQVGVFTFTRELPNTAAGYIITFQTCCRTNTVVNIISQPPQTEGATYTGQIPGTNTISAGTNSSPVFALKDTAIVCTGSPFVLDFSANDPDVGDSLSYSLCSAYNRGNTINSQSTAYSAPPYDPVLYQPGYSGTTPLGDLVTINPVTGIISGIAPSIEGRYVVTVCITEWRNGKLISNHRKDFTLRINPCSLTAAVLKPAYITCTGTTLFFQNESTNPNINSYLWDFGVASLTNDTSTSPTPSFDYLKSGKDSGTYTLKLKVSTVGGCQDSTTAQVKVYPGFSSGFVVSGTCFLNNYLFSDTSKIKYGSVTSRLWNFGDATSVADTAHAKDTAWKYPAAATAQVRLIVGNNIGCIDTITKPLTILDKPVLNLPFRDTLICSIDTLMLRVNITSGSVLWTPMDGPNKTRILNTTSASPLVFPRDTTKYYVSVNDNGCANTDSVTVNVLQFITINAGLDTGICRTDTFRLSPISDALSYQWTTSTGVPIQNTKYPLVQPLTHTQYYVVANLGKCEAKDTILVNVTPYPNALAGNDATICYGTRVQLNGSITGTTFTWTPVASLINERTLSPVAGPTRTTMYILSAYDTLGCPKPKTDTVLVTVIPVINAYAGRDTAVIPGQELQLVASGGTGYAWTPTTGLSNPSIANPIAILDNTIDSITYTVRVSNGSCYADDQIKVRVFKTGPDIIVPSAFTPNGDGKNDVSRPVLLGITKLYFFSIYNRWGQLLFTTTEENKGWDGNFAGVAQPSGAYVYQASGIDFLGRAVLRKGTVVLIR